MRARSIHSRFGRFLCGFALALSLGVMLASCEKQEESYEEDPEAFARARAAKANPASLNCKQASGTLRILKRGDGGEYGVCRFEDGRECEEWAMLLGFCPPGGVEVAQYKEPAVRYCVLRGGRAGASDTGAPGAVCQLPGGVACGVEDFHAGRCQAKHR